MAIDVPIEYDLFQDDVKMIAEMLREDWSLGDHLIPSISYEPKSYMMDARHAGIYVYHTTTSYSFASIDYRNMSSTTYIGVKVGAPIRKNFYEAAREVMRILAANRRAGPKYLNGNQFIHLVDKKFQNEPSGWYTVTFTLRLVNNSIGYKTAGFGNEINKRIQEVDPAINGEDI